MNSIKWFLFEEFASPEKKSIISGPFGSSISKKYFKEKGIPVIRGNNLSKNFIKFIDSGFVYVTEEKAKSLNTYAIIDDLVFTAVGTLGQVGLIHKNLKYEEYIISNKQLRVRIDKQKLYPVYAFYWFTSPWMIDTIQKRNVGSTVPLINLSIVRGLPICVPENIQTQKSIAKVLSDLDAKIELNNKINRELEAMAKMLYDYWFVQFDFPNEQGKPYKASGGKMVYSEELKRDIPEGWEVGTLLDIATYTNGLACQKYRPDTEDFLPVIKIREMRDGFTENTEKVKTDIPEKLIVNNGDILFSWSASLEVIIWSGGTGGLNQHIFKVTSEKYPKSFYYFQLIWYLQHFKMIAELRKTTMGHITQDHLKQSRIVIPPIKTINKLDIQLRPIQTKQVLLNQQNQQLTTLRDWLLPMLMNGQITVGKAEE